MFHYSNNILNEFPQVCDGERRWRKVSMLNLVQKRKSRKSKNILIRGLKIWNIHKRAATLILGWKIMQCNIRLSSFILTNIIITPWNLWRWINDFTSWLFTAGELDLQAKGIVQGDLLQSILKDWELMDIEGLTLSIWQWSIDQKIQTHFNIHRMWRTILIRDFLVKEKL